MIKLKTPVTNVLPAKLYRDSDERNKTVWFICSGGTVTGLTGEAVGYKENNRTLRKAQNKIDKVTKSDLRFIFDKGKKGIELEGVCGNGDSGGPAFIVQDNQFYLLGVSSRADSWFKDVAEYGVKELYTRVSVHADWVDSVIAANETQRPKISSLESFLQPGMTPEKMPQICASIGFMPNNTL